MSETVVRSAARVNAGSRSPLVRALAFTVATLALVGAAPVAQAERALVLQPLGNLDDDERDRVEDAIHEALNTLSFTPMSEGVSLTAVEEREIPESANEFQALAEMQRCEWVIVSTIRPVDEKSYVLKLRVGSRAGTRVDELEFEVRRSREAPRLVEVLRVMLRPQGMGTDGAQFAGQDAVAREAEAAAQTQEDAASQAAREREEAEARARAEAEARDRAAREAAEQAAWSGRERYGRPQRMMVQGSLGIYGILNPPTGATGGGVADITGRFGYAVAPGLEIRAGLGAVFGAAGGVDLFAGAAYFFSPFKHLKLHIGATAELGLFGMVTGHKGAGFLFRMAPAIAWHVTDKVWLEADIPSFAIRTAGSGVALLGGEVRVGTRF